MFNELQGLLAFQFYLFLALLKLIYCPQAVMHISHNKKAKLNLNSYVAEFPTSI